MKKLKRSTFAMILSFSALAMPITVFAGTQTVARGLTWLYDSYIQSNGARYCYSQLNGYNYDKWVQVKMTYDTKSSGWISRNDPEAYTWITGSMWETGRSFYDYNV